MQRKTFKSNFIKALVAITILLTSVYIRLQFIGKQTEGIVPDVVRTVNLSDFDNISDRVVMIKNSTTDDSFNAANGLPYDILYIFGGGKPLTSVVTKITQHGSGNIDSYQIKDDKLYFFSTKDLMIKSIDFAGNVTDLDFTKVDSFVYSGSFLVSPNAQKIAWVETVFRDSGISSAIHIADIDGRQQRIVYEKTLEDENYFKVLKWSKSGNDIYFSEQRGGLGGYIIFSGYFNLNKINIESGKAESLVPSSETEMITDISSNEKFVAHFIGFGENPKLAIRNLETGKDILVDIPIDEGFRGGGNAVFSPEQSYIAYNIAHWDPSNEYYRTMVVDITGKNNKQIIDLQDKYFTVKKWLTNKDIIVQDSGDYHTVNIDDLKLKKLELPTT